MPDDDLVREVEVRHGTGAYEQTDVSIKVIIYFVAALIVLGVAGQVILAFGYWRLAKETKSEPLSQIADWRELPPAPRLQVSPTRDMSEFLRAEQKILAAQNVPGRISIEEAMQRVLRAGLPARATPPTEPPAAPVPLESGGPNTVLPPALRTGSWPSAQIVGGAAAGAESPASAERPLSPSPGASPRREAGNDGGDRVAR